MVYFGTFLFLLFVRLPILKLRLCFYVVLVNYYFFVLFCDMDYFVNISFVYKVINSTPNSTLSWLFLKYTRLQHLSLGKFLFLEVAKI